MAKRRYEQHGYTSGGYPPEYWIWRAMIRRCHDEGDPSYHRYGGRGIVVCDRWRESFGSFMEDVGARPDPKLTLDRIDNDGNYEPENVRWATRRQQNLNRKGGGRTLTIGGETKPLVEWADEAGISRQLLRKRIDKMGWSPERAVSTPVNKSMARRSSR